MQSNESLGLIRSSVYLNLALRAIPADGLMNCSKPGITYPLLNGCHGWNFCGQNNMVYSFSCGSVMCYNVTSNRCDISNEKTNMWFNCAQTDVGKLVSWPQKNTTYGLCIHENVVVFMNNCFDGQIFCQNKQTCAKKC